MSEHYAVVDIDTDHLDRLAQIRDVTDDDRADSYRMRVECSDPADCPGWEECREDHDGMDPEDDESPAYDQYEDVIIHGQPHEWKSCHGWTVDYPGCPVVNSNAAADVPDGVHMDRPGRYLLDEDWDDTDFVLFMVREVADDE